MITEQIPSSVAVRLSEVEASLTETCTQSPFDSAQGDNFRKQQAYIFPLIITEQIPSSVAVRLSEVEASLAGEFTQSPFDSAQGDNFDSAPGDNFGKQQAYIFLLMITEQIPSSVAVRLSEVEASLTEARTQSPSTPLRVTTSTPLPVTTSESSRRIFSR